MAGGFKRERVVLPASARLPQTTRLALDIGGSLAKVGFIVKEKEVSTPDFMTIELVSFNADEIDTCLDYITHHVVGRTNGPTKSTIRATGVGCMKHREKITSTLHAKLDADCAEMTHAVRGLNVLWTHLPPAQITYNPEDLAGKAVKEQTSLAESGLCPLLFVNIGSAMTIVGVDKAGNVTNILGGSTLAGHTFLGLGSLLTKAKSFSELLDLANSGDRRNVDLLVKDTAGAHYNKAPPEGMVSSFGKPAKALASDTEVVYKEEDIADSLLFAITDNLAQQAYITAKAERAHTICFCGSYVEDNPKLRTIIQDKLKTASLYLGHAVTPLFLRHESYLGVIGALIGQHTTTNGAGSAEGSKGEKGTEWTSS